MNFFEVFCTHPESAALDNVPKNVATYFYNYDAHIALATILVSLTSSAASA